MEAGGNRKQFDAELRPERFAQAVKEMHSAGVFPDVWKIEGTETKQAMDVCSAAVFEGGSQDVQIVILGRGESMEKVEHWLTVGAQSKGVTGFAVGRTIFAEALLNMKNGQYSQQQAAQEIAERYEYFINVFENAKR
jgi:5-dehydro-2-deoxygluconokinase